jgi:hypothetical protein
MQDVDGRDKPGHDVKILKLASVRLDSGDFRHQIGQLSGGVEPADGVGGGGHRGQPRRLGGEAGDFRRQPVGGEIAIGSAPPACSSTPALAN